LSFFPSTCEKKWVQARGLLATSAMPSRLKILFAVSSLDGFQVGAPLAGLVCAGGGASVTLLHADMKQDSREEEEALSLLARVQGGGADVMVGACGRPAACEVRDSKDPARTILDAAAEMAADLILVSCHQRHGSARLLVGSVTERLVRDADRPVLSVPLAWREAAHPRLSRILVPIVEQRASPAALAWARRFARQDEGMVGILRLHYDDRPLPAGVHRFKAEAGEGLDFEVPPDPEDGTCPELVHPESVRSRLVMRNLSATEEILDHAATWGSSLTVLTRWTSGRREDVFIGSTIERCLRHSLCPVLVVPA
jgi:nucleotide-binding universal stress UspA family protein